MWTTSAPAPRAPLANASASSGELGRMSWPITTVPAPTTCTKAAPVARASALSICSGNVPRTS